MKRRGWRIKCNCKRRKLSPGHEEEIKERRNNSKILKKTADSVVKLFAPSCVYIFNELHFFPNFKKTFLTDTHKKCFTYVSNEKDRSKKKKIQFYERKKNTLNNRALHINQWFKLMPSARIYLSTESDNSAFTKIVARVFDREGTRTNAWSTQKCFASEKKHKCMSERKKKRMKGTNKEKKKRSNPSSSKDDANDRSMSRKERKENTPLGICNGRVHVFR